MNGEGCNIGYKEISIPTKKFRISNIYILISYMWASGTIDPILHIIDTFSLNFIHTRISQIFTDILVMSMSDRH